MKQEASEVYLSIWFLLQRWGSKKDSIQRSGAGALVQDSLASVELVPVKDSP